jgi:hypothetical protein
MALIPIPAQPLPIVWQNTVVDIEPTSRYGTPGETPDTASINTTLVLQNPHPGPVQFIVPGHHEAEASARPLGEAEGQRADLVAQGDPRFADLMSQLEELQRQLQADAGRVQALLEKVKQFHSFQLELGQGNRIVRFFTRLPIIREPDESYKFSELVPREFTQLITHGDFSVVVFPPRSAEGYDQPPLYKVELLEWSTDVETQVFGRDALPAVGRRLAVSWWWRNDPLLTVRYRYTT